MAVSTFPLHPSHSSHEVMNTFIALASSLDPCAELARLLFFFPLRALLRARRAVRFRFDAPFRLEVRLLLFTFAGAEEGEAPEGVLELEVGLPGELFADMTKSGWLPSLMEAH